MQTNVINTIGIVLMIVLSVTAFNTFSFAANTNDTKNQSFTPSITTNEKKTSSSIATIPVKSNTSNPTTSLTSVPSSSTCTGTDNYLWNHVYDVNNGQPWGQNPGRLNITPDKQYKYGSCVTVTGQVYSAVPTGGTHDEPDGDLHFTLALNKTYWGLSNDDPKCNPSPSHGLPIGCRNIIVEVICHKDPDSSYLKHGNYCDKVNSIYPHGQFPQQGVKLKVSGKLVRDDGEGKWNELHPASYIQIIH
ncbi:MAG: hypothetical protein ACTHKF_07415 [Candidatus Nitrosocosmicus sp.]